MIVGRITGNIVRIILCGIVYHSYTHMSTVLTDDYHFRFGFLFLHLFLCQGQFACVWLSVCHFVYAFVRVLRVSFGLAV